MSALALALSRLSSGGRLDCDGPDDDAQLRYLGRRLGEHTHVHREPMLVSSGKKVAHSAQNQLYGLNTRAINEKLGACPKGIEFILQIVYA